MLYPGTSSCSQEWKKARIVMGIYFHHSAINPKSEETLCALLQNQPPATQRCSHPQHASLPCKKVRGKKPFGPSLIFESKLRIGIYMTLFSPVKLEQIRNLHQICPNCYCSLPSAYRGDMS